MREQAVASSVYPFITIAIPTYNRAALAKNCVMTALAQTYPNIEVLVLNNASTDDTLATLREIKDARLRIVTNPQNVGLVGNFNNCVREARGDYIVLISDDNTLEPTFLEKCVRLVRQEPDLPIVLGLYDSMVFDEFNANNRRVVPVGISRKLTTGIWDGIEILREYMHGRLTAQTLSSIIRTDIVRKNGGYSPDHPYRGDEAVWIPALLEGRAGLVNEKCATYFVHDASYSSKLSPDQLFGDLCKVMEELSSAAESKVADPAKRREFQKLTARYVAFHAILTLVLYRRSGASLIDVVKKLRSWRNLLQRCSFVDFATTVRLRAWGRILLPQPLVRLLFALRMDRLV